MAGQHRTGQFRYRTGDQALVRQINLSVIMHQLRENAPISRAALAEMTGLNKSTVSSLVRELIERQFVREVGLESPGAGRGAGRLAMLLTLDPGAGYVASLEIGVDFLLAICTNFAPEVIWRKSEEIKPEMGQQVIVDRALALLHQAVEAGRRECKTLLGVAVGVPGLVDQHSGNLLFAPNLQWENVPIGAYLRDAFDSLIIVDNEASLSALGEHYFGAAQNCDEVLYISAGVGLGGGIVHDGRMFSGVSGFGAEFGHMTMDPDGLLCNCGNQGCWETQVSQRTLFRNIRLGIETGRSSLIADLIGEDLSRLTIPLLVEAARAGDALVLENLEMIGHKLGIGIASLVNALNPDLVVFGGILSTAGEYLLPAIEEELQQRALRWNRSVTQVVTARHGFNACVMGGVAKVYQAILAEPDAVRTPNAWISPFQFNHSGGGLVRKEVKDETE